MGIASAGGAGKALAEWIVNDGPTMDLWPVDIRRFANFNNNPTWLHDRIKETLGLHYAMPWPNRELETARPFRRSPLYDKLQKKGAVFGSKMGWERANWFAEPGQKAETEYSFARQNWHENVAKEHKAVREAVAVFDQTSFAKLLVQGRDACTALNFICAANVDVAIGSSVYTGMLNKNGGFESDLTVMRLARDKFLLVTGSAQAIHDADWITRNIAEDQFVTVTDVTSAWSVLSVMGPKSRDVLKKLSKSDFSNAAFPFATIQEIDLGYSTVYANRMTYVGELGWELVMPTEFAVGVYDDLFEAGAEFGIIDAGYYALEGLRLEKGFRAWSRELHPDISPLEAGLSFAVAMDKPGGFVGREALLAKKQQGPVKKRIVQFVLTDPEAQLWGGELVLRDGQTIGEVRSAAYGHTLKGATALAQLTHDEGITNAFIQTGHYQIDLAGKLFDAVAHIRSPYDPSSARVKSDG